MNKAFKDWLKTRPKNVQEFAAQHPYEPGNVLELDGKPMWFLGYGEYEGGDVGLIVSPINPEIDYDAALKQAQHICPTHFLA